MMKLFRKKQPEKIPYDPEKQEPAVRRSICTGEMTLGFVDRESGRFLDYALARNQEELEAFCRGVGIDADRLRTVY